MVTSSGKPLRICLVCSEYPPTRCGGLGIVTQTLARGFVAAGHTIRVIGIYAPEDPAPDDEETDGILIRRLRMPRHPGGWLRARRALYRQIRDWAVRQEIDLVEIPLSRGYAAGWGPLPVPLAIRYHGSSMLEDWLRHRRPPRLPKLLEQMALHRADDHCGVSRFIIAAVSQCFKLPRPAGTIPVLSNPVDLSRLPPLIPLALRSGQSAVFAGTLQESKGVTNLVTAWSQWRSACPTAELHLIGADGRTGSGESMTAWLARTISSPASLGIILHGYIRHPEVLEAFSRAKVAVFPSKIEAFGLAAAEAMACGCPTIFTAQTAGPELIVHQQSGWLVDPEEPAQITRALETIGQHPEIAAALSRAGRQRIQEHFSLEQLLPRNEAFFRECMARFKASR